MAADSLSAWVIAAVAAGILGTLAFLVRGAFESLQKGIGDLGSKMDTLTKAMATADIHAAGFESEVRGELRALRERMDRLERDLSEGIAR